MEIDINNRSMTFIDHFAKLLAECSTIKAVEFEVDEDMLYYCVNPLFLSLKKANSNLYLISIIFNTLKIGGELYDYSAYHNLANGDMLPLTTHFKSECGKLTFPVITAYKMFYLTCPISVWYKFSYENEDGDEARLSQQVQSNIDKIRAKRTLGNNLPQTVHIPDDVQNIIVTYSRPKCKRCDKIVTY